MSLPSWLRAVLPPDTAIRWEQVGPVIPAGALLVGGTALTVHLQHRLSHDLDFFVPESFDTGRLATELSRLAPFAVTLQDDRTLNGGLGHTKLQFLDASNQWFVEPSHEVAGIRVAGLGDILATKLKVIQDCGEHRDYDEDPGVPEPLSVTTSYWQARIPALIAWLDRTATVLRPAAHERDVSPGATPPQAPGSAGSVQVEGYTRADGTAVRGYTRRC